MKKALLGLLAVPVVGGIAAVLLSSPTKAAPKPGTAGGAVDQGNALPFVRYSCPSCPDGFAYALRPELRDALWNALPNWIVIGQDMTDGIVTWTLSPRDPKSPPNTDLQSNLQGAKAQGYTILVDPAFVWPTTGSRTIKIVPPSMNPWVMTLPSLVWYYGSGPWSVTPGPEAKKSATASCSFSVSSLPGSMQTMVQHVADVGPLRTQYAVATSLDDDGYHDAATWMRAQADKRKRLRQSDAVAHGGFFEYVLRPGELPPYMWTERYLGAGNGPRYKEIQQPKGWNYGQVIRIPAVGQKAWPDPEMIDPDTLIGTMKGKPPAPLPSTVQGPVNVPPSGGLSPNDQPVPPSGGGLGDVRLYGPAPPNPSIGKDPTFPQIGDSPYPWQSPNVSVADLDLSDMSG